MRRALLAILVLSFGLSVLQGQTGQAHSPKIYVAPLESTVQGLADMVRAKLISHLVKHGLTVVESEEKADAILTGDGLMQGSTNEYGHTHYRLHAGMRLVSKAETVIWADDVASGRFAQSASSSFAENVAKSIEDALSAKSEKQ